MIEVKALLFSVLSIFMIIIGVTEGDAAGWCDSEIWVNGKEGEV